jgi:hypothetical protein
VNLKVSLLVLAVFFKRGVCSLQSEFGKEQKQRYDAYAKIASLSYHWCDCDFFFKPCVFVLNTLFSVICEDGSWIARGIDGGRLLAVLYESNAAAFHTAYSLQ